MFNYNIDDYNIDSDFYSSKTTSYSRPMNLLDYFNIIPPLLKNLPFNIKYVALDSDGELYGYYKKPIFDKDNESYEYQTGGCVYLGIFNVDENINFELTLIEIEDKK